MSVGGKLASATILLMVMVTAVGYSELSSNQREHLLHAKQMAALAVTRLFADSCAAPIVFEDNVAIKDMLYRLSKNDDIPYAAVWSADAQGRADRRLVELGSDQPVEVGPIPAILDLRREPGRLILLAPVSDLDGKLVGAAIVTFSLLRENAVIAQVQSNMLLASGAIAAVLTVLLLTIARFAIVRPLGKLVIAANEIERGMASDIEVRSRDEIGQLALAFRSMAHAITSREERIVARNRDMRLVLDNVGQGFLTLDRQAQLSEERSRVVEEWFGAPDPGAPFWVYLSRVDSKAGERFEVGWMLVTDDVMPLELGLDNLPQLIHADSRVFELAYRPILKGDALDQLLVVITDVSARIERERALVVERETMSIFKRIVADRGVFEEFFDEATVLVTGIQSSDGSDRAGLQRSVHTLKGNAAVYELESIAALCHTIESELQSSGGVVSDERKRELDTLWARVAGIRAEFSTDSGITVRRDEHRALLLALDARGPADLAAWLASWQFEPASRRLTLMGGQIKALAGRLGRGDVNVRVEPTVLRLPSKRWAPLWAASSHLVRNTVDHGLEAPERRAALGKPVPATVTLSLTRAEHELILVLQDDGRGIDWVAIANRGRSLGLPVDTPEELEAALFAQGVSSRHEVTATSGRGVGLNAVREVVNALGGRIEVQSELGKGARFAIHLPDSMLSEERSHAHDGTPSAHPSLGAQA
jgi:HAMP domain-containing protein/HPt (histidine-containing phosphotransfer) domain-containing protein